jgi:geranylgeranyl diphosphate synthase type II
MTEELRSFQQRITDQLDICLTLPQAPAQLVAAMRYAVFNGGKRIRPGLVYLAGQALGSTVENSDKSACAIELIHCYSLIHDDLPSMDDDDLRRGQPTVHIQFDEATAILAGDGLQALAFELVAKDQHLDADTRLDIIRILSHAAGPSGMVGGQSIDLAAESRQISAAELENMHRRKTGDLIAACLQVAACIKGADELTQNALVTYGYSLGLAFQIRDDILDHTGDTATLGKPSGSDLSNHKSTFVSLHGLAGARDQLELLRLDAIDALTPLGPAAAPLIALANYISSRTY